MHLASDRTQQQILLVLVLVLPLPDLSRVAPHNDVRPECNAKTATKKAKSNDIGRKGEIVIRCNVKVSEWVCNF